MKNISLVIAVNYWFVSLGYTNSEIGTSVESFIPLKGKLPQWLCT